MITVLTKERLTTLGALPERCMELISNVKCLGCGEIVSIDVWNTAGGECQFCQSTKFFYSCGRCSGRFDELFIGGDHFCHSLKIYENTKKIVFEDLLERGLEEEVARIEAAHLAEVERLVKEAVEIKGREERARVETERLAHEEAERVARESFDAFFRDASPYGRVFSGILSIIGLLLVNGVAYGEWSTITRISVAIGGGIAFAGAVMCRQKEKGFNTDFWVTFSLLVIISIIMSRISGGRDSIGEKAAACFLGLIFCGFVSPLFFGRAYGKALIFFSLILVFVWKVGLNFPPWLGFPQFVPKFSSQINSPSLPKNSQQDEAASLIPELADNGSPSEAELVRTVDEFGRGRIGIVVKAVSRELADSFGLQSVFGAIVTGVEKDGPADRGGIVVGDIILRFDGKSIDMVKDLPQIVGSTPPGTDVIVRVWRNGTTKGLTVSVGGIPDARVASRPLPIEIQRPTTEALRRTPAVRFEPAVAVVNRPTEDFLIVNCQSPTQAFERLICSDNTLIEQGRRIGELLKRKDLLEARAKFELFRKNLASCEGKFKFCLEMAYDRFERDL